MNWLYDHEDYVPHTIDVDTYDRLSVYGKRTVNRLLEDHDFDPRTVFLIEIVPGRARILFYKTDEAGNLYVDEDDEIAFSERVVYDGNIQKATYYDLNGNVHQSLIYKL